MAERETSLARDVIERSSSLLRSISSDKWDTLSQEITDLFVEFESLGQGSDLKLSRQELYNIFKGRMRDEGLLIYELTEGISEKLPQE